MSIRSVFCGAVYVLALASNAVFAQATQPGAGLAAESSAAPPAVKAADNGLAEIIVTANKRSESIDNVPLAIAAITGDELKQQGVSSVQDLSRLVPGLNVTAATYGTDVYTIRGVGFYDTTLAAVPAVSVYVDEVPLPFSVMANGASLDPERVEVLMGPQGTLFGQNSTGGAINYIAAKPTKNFEAGVTATLANYETENVDGYVSGPLSDTLSARVSFMSDNSEQGWQKSVSRDDRLGKVDQQQGRLLLDWKPTDRLSFLLNVNGFYDGSDTQAPRYLGYVLNYPTLAFTVPQLTSASPTTGGPSNADWDANTAFRKNNKFYQISLRGDYQLNDNFTLTNIAAYSHYDHNQNQELDGLSINNLKEQIIGSIDSYSEELRLSGNLTDRLKFITGGNYQNDKVNEDDFGYIDIYTGSFLPTFFGLPRWHTFEDLSNQKMDSYAVFANLDYDLTDSLALHAGGRYTHTKTDDVGCTSGDAGLTGLFKSANPPGSCLTATSTGVQGDVVNTLDEDNVSWRFAADYKPTPGVLLYASVSRGFKAGGYPELPASTYIQLEPVKQEELTSYETGFKANMFDHTVRLSGAVFHYDYTDKQIRGRLEDPVFGLLEKLINIPKSSLNGAEATFQWKPTTGLNLNGGLSYVRSKIGNFTAYDVTSKLVNLDGASFPNAPDFRGNVSAQYDWSVRGSLTPFIGTDYSYASSTRGTLGFTPQLNIPSYGLLGAQAGIHSADDKLRFWLWGKNLTNKFYLTGANLSAEALIAYAGMPRTFGATVSYNFK